MPPAGTGMGTHHRLSPGAVLRPQKQVYTLHLALRALGPLPQRTLPWESPVASRGEQHTQGRPQPGHLHPPGTGAGVGEEHKNANSVWGKKKLNLRVTGLWLPLLLNRGNNDTLPVGLSHGAWHRDDAPEVPGQCRAWLAVTTVTGHHHGPSGRGRGSCSLLAGTELAGRPAASSVA